MLRPASLVVFALALLCSCGSKGGSAPTNPGGGGGGGGNHSPTANINTNTMHLAYAETANIGVTASDPDGDQLTFSYAATGGTVTSSGPTATTATFTAANQWGPATVTVTASDGKGGSVQATATMYVRNPNPPAFTFRAVSSSYCGYGQTRPECYQVEATSPEAVSVREFDFTGGPAGAACGVEWQYTPAQALGANQPHMFESPQGPNSCAGCTTCDTYFDVTIYGDRPEPDGGSFYYTRHAWHP